MTWHPTSFPFGLALLLGGLGLLFGLALLSTLLPVLWVAKSSGSHKHEQHKCCADNSISFHGCYLDYSVDAGKLLRCIVLNSREIPEAMEFSNRWLVNLKHLEGIR